MAVSAPIAVPNGTVAAKLNFSRHPPEGQLAFGYVDTPPAGEPQTNVEKYGQEVTLEDVRGRESEFSLDRDAFQVIQGVPASKEAAFADDDSIRANYYPEVEKLLLDQIPGSNRVFLFDHTVRRADPSASRRAVQIVHIDQTAYSAEKRVRRHMGADAEALLRGRYRIVNVWRPLNRGPVESMPLGFASSATLDQRDVIPVEHRYPSGYVGQTAAIAHNPAQKWYYLSGMTGDERLLLECFDSESLKEGSAVEGGRVAHTAFEHPLTRPDAEGRESIEIRALVFGP
ncbi:putative 7alpha-cephem-methoxylase p8 chain related protein [Rosellinia necatrix]|uniref:Putative 7alpha-cephem-methoxylase p8 chain related protein n=1 Tax=Rosellinia necatrix TaxID=77044 RepID=A0A1W2TI56_ROSNE|nr:putative 7alpha-cephem-methoxylase p8 chain related protein [Rosellinia necatrix]